MTIMSMERVRQYWDQLRAKGVIIATAGAMALGLVGCTSDNEEAPLPQDTATYVETDAAPGPLDPYNTISTSDLTSGIAAQPDAADRYEELRHSDPATGKELFGDFPLDKSAPLLTISLGENKKLIYEDSTPGLIPAESQLLTTVQENAPLLTAAMNSGRLNSLRFRIFEADDSIAASAYAPSEEMFFLPKDYTDEGKPNMYYFLPSNDVLDTEAISALARHESFHAALDHGPDKIELTAEQRSRFQQACGTLRAGALKEMRTWDWQARLGLHELWNMAPATLKPAYEAVITALEDGTYGELPTYFDADEVQECYVQAPFTAVLKQADLMGQTVPMDQERAKEAVMDQVGIIQDSWNNNIEDQTVYRLLKEGDWLAPTKTNKDKGHPQDGLSEISVSSINRMVGDAEAFGRDVAGRDTDIQEAIIGLLDLQTELLHQKYPHNKELLRQIADNRAIFDKALGR
jgi:hypothetical protein